MVKQEIETIFLINNINNKEIINFLKENGYQVNQSQKKKSQLKKYLYFDTPNKDLLKTNYIFRIRLKKSEKGEHKVTYKIPIEQNNDYINKKEIELKFMGEPTIENALFKFKKQYPRVKIPKDLKQVVNLEKARETYHLVDGNNLFEITFDNAVAINPLNGEKRLLPKEMEIEILKASIESLIKVKKLILNFNREITLCQKSKYQLATEMFL